VAVGAMRALDLSPVVTQVSASPEERDDPPISG
jgi:hypothetical protein